MMHRRTRAIAMSILIFILAVLPAFAESKIADWSSDELKQPIAVDGRIWHENQNSYSFVLNHSGIPTEPVVVKAKISDEIMEAVKDDGDAEGDEAKAASALPFDPEKIKFVTDGFTSYIGAKVTSIRPGTTVYTENGNIYDGEGSNIDIIKGGSARLSLDYNPEYTHQTGAIWYCVSDSTYSDFTALAGSSYCTVLGSESTDVTGGNDPSAPTESKYRPKVLRALSIYDPWFDEMEARYGDQAREEYSQAHPEATDAQVAAMTWKSMYLKKTDKEHRDDGEKGMWRYPNETTDTITIYTDFQITVRSPIEMVTFTSRAEYQLGDGTTQAPHYMLFNDQVAHPDMTATNKIWCYDTSDASGGHEEVGAFRIECRIDPDYGYSLQFELVQGSSIGHLDFTELDGNTFRFVPKGEFNVNGEMKKNYGPVIIKVTAEEVNYSKYFTLMYVPSNMKLVKYIGENADGTVPDGWDVGIQIDPVTGEVLDSSGEWDVVTYKKDNQDVIQLYGMECLVLYPGEEFSLSMVQYVDNKDGRGKQPYYMTNGVMTVDYSSPIYGEDGSVTYEEDITKYRVTYSVTKTSDPDSPLQPGVLEFSAGNARLEESYDPVIEGRGDVLIETAENTGQSWWYSTNEQTVRAIEEGTYYLRFTVSPVEDEGPNAGEVSLSESTLTGGVNLYVVSPVNQALANVVNAQKTSSLDIVSEIPFRISAGQRTGVHGENNAPLPSHWYLGEKRGAVGYEVPSDEEGKKIYYGSAYAVFEAEDFSSRYGAEDSLNLDRSQFMDGTEAISFGDKYLVIADNEANRPPTPHKATNDWGGVLAISVSTDNEGKEIKDGPNITDVRVTGSYGLSRFPNINRLRIIDTATNPMEEGAFTKANLIQENGKDIWNFQSLKLYRYEHANMGLTGNDIDIFYTPSELEVLNLDSGYIVSQNPSITSSTAGNQLDCEFKWGANTQQSLKEIRIGNNSFQNFTLSGFDSLQAVFANGSMGLVDTGAKRSLVIYDCPELEYVDADETSYNNIMVEFPRDKGDKITDIDDGYRVETLLRVNNSPYLEKVNVSGQLDYLELTGDPKLVSLIGSNTFSPTDPDNFTMSSWPGDLTIASDAGWIRTVNLGGELFRGNIRQTPITGFFAQETAGIDNDTYLYSDENQSYYYFMPYRGKPNDVYKSGSNGIVTLELNYIYRLFSDAYGSSFDVPNLSSDSSFATIRDAKDALARLEVFCIVPDQAASDYDFDVLDYNPVSGAKRSAGQGKAVTTGGETFLSSANTAGQQNYNIYGFDYRHAGSPSTVVRFHHVPANASINLGDSGIKSLEILDFKGFLSLYKARNIDDLHINENTSDVGESTIEMSRSGVTDFNGTSSLSSVIASPTSIDILIPDDRDDEGYTSSSPYKVADVIQLSASPSTFNSRLSVQASGIEISENLRDFVFIDSIGRADDDGIAVTLKAYESADHKLDPEAAPISGTITLKGTCSSDSGDSVTWEKVTVNVTLSKECRTEYEWELVGGEMEGDTMVVEYNTRNDEPLLIELKCYEEGEEINIFNNVDYGTPADNSPFYYENGVQMTYEQGYEYCQTSIGYSVVTWSFSPVASNGQDYAEIILDSYIGNKVKIKPLVDDQEYTCLVHFDNNDGARFEAAFIVRVTGGQSDRWQLKIDPSGNPYILDGIGDRESFTITLLDKQILTNNSPTTVPPDQYEGNISWSAADGSIFSYTVPSESGHGQVVNVEGLKVGSDVLTASYLNGAVTASTTIVVDGATLPEPSKTSGSFSIEDSGASGSRDNVWDIPWNLKVTTGSGTPIPYNASSFVSGTIRFTTSKGTFDFQMRRSSANGYVSFDPSSCTSFRIDVVASRKTSCSGGSGCTNGLPWNGQYDDKKSKLASTSSQHNCWLIDGRQIFDIQPYMMDLLESGTAEIISLTFSSNGEQYTWTKPAAKMASSRASVMRLSAVEPARSISIPEELRHYRQTSLEKSSFEAEIAIVNGERVYVNPGRWNDENIGEFQDMVSPRLRPMRLAASGRSAGDTTVINAGVYRLDANNCANLDSVEIGRDNADQKAIYSKLKVLNVNRTTGSSRLSKIAIKMDPIFYISAYGNTSLSGFSVQTTGAALEFIDVHGCSSLGSGSLAVNGFSYSGGSRRIGKTSIPEVKKANFNSYVGSNFCSTTIDWQSDSRNKNISIFYAYDCNIYYYFYIEVSVAGTPNAGQKIMSYSASPSFRPGSIPEGKLSLKMYDAEYYLRNAYSLYGADFTYSHSMSYNGSRSPSPSSSTRHIALAPFGNWSGRQYTGKGTNYFSKISSGAIGRAGSKVSISISMRQPHYTLTRMELEIHPFGD